MKVLVCLLSASALCACTKQGPTNLPKEKEAEPSLSLAAQNEIQDPRLKQVESLFEVYKRSHIEKSMMTLKTIYPGDLAIKASWKGVSVPSGNWMDNRKKFMNPIKSVEFTDAKIFAHRPRNSYVVVFKELVETYDKRKTVYYGYLEQSQAGDSHFSVEEISVKESDYNRWLKGQPLN